jgi:hypothetical protein
MLEANFKLPYNRETIFKAIPKAIKNLGWRLDDLNPKYFRFRAKTKWSFWGWGSKIEGYMSELNPHLSQLRIEGKITKQIFDYGVTRERVIQFMDELDSILTNRKRQRKRYLPNRWLLLKDKEIQFYIFRFVSLMLLFAYGMNYGFEWYTSIAVLVLFFSIIVFFLPSKRKYKGMSPSGIIGNILGALLKIFVMFIFAIIIAIFIYSLTRNYILILGLYPVIFGFLLRYFFKSNDSNSDSTINDHDYNGKQIQSKNDITLKYINEWSLEDYYLRDYPDRFPLTGYEMGYGLLYGFGSVILGFIIFLVISSAFSIFISSTGRINGVPISGLIGWVIVIFFGILGFRKGIDVAGDYYVERLPITWKQIKYGLLYSFGSIILGIIIYLIIFSIFGAYFYNYIIINSVSIMRLIGTMIIITSGILGFKKGSSVGGEK